MDEYESTKNYRLFYSFMAMKTFSELTGIQWLVKTEA